MSLCARPRSEIVPHALQITRGLLIVAGGGPVAVDSVVEGGLLLPELGCRHGVKGKQTLFLSCRFLGRVRTSHFCSSLASGLFACCC